MELTESHKKWLHPWLLAHRIDLHNHLKRVAMTATEQYSAVPLHNGLRIACVDAETATITLQDGTHVQEDVVIGADGVHSVTRHAIPGGQLKAACRGKSAFRFLVSKDAALSDPTTAKLVQHQGQLIIWCGSNRRIIVYPTSDNTVLNFVAIHPEDESATESASCF
jgi:2-polyprenyl-6-methoxyphenol hydroxylase-like FAD-dependent oxidoreductase